ncbi:dihydrofolate reductase family protein [Micromonospora sp. NPDC094482]|uniref:dihydrofolate reductase family protein n=1 Tax=unclassified Micromonospora TaxID=2617518 RepID=UPI0033302A4C
MRKLVVYTLLSLDGVAESPDRYLFNFDEEMYANLGRVIDAQDTVLLGRRMYDEWAPYWTTSTDEPFASFINGVRKYVITSTEPTQPWANTTVVSGPLTPFVQDLKARPGRDIGVHGSIQLARSLFDADLVDELRLLIAPAVAGAGRKLFSDDTSLRKLRLLRAAKTSSGGLLVDYEVLNPA